MNRISAGVYARAAGAVTGMADAAVKPAAEKYQGTARLKPLAAATMFGNTTPAVEGCKERIEAGGVMSAGKVPFQAPLPLEPGRDPHADKSGGKPENRQDDRRACKLFNRTCFCVPAA